MMVDGVICRKDVQQIQSTRNAFCALLADGFVVTWGDPGAGAHGGDLMTLMWTSQMSYDVEHACNLNCLTYILNI